MEASQVQAQQGQLLHLVSKNKRSQDTAQSKGLEHIPRTGKQTKILQIKPLVFIVSIEAESCDLLIN